MRHTVILIGRVENGVAESVHGGAPDDVEHNVFQAAADVVIDRDYHSIAAYHSAAHHITLFQ